MLGQQQLNNNNNQIFGNSGLDDGLTGNNNNFQVVDFGSPPRLNPFQRPEKLQLGSLPVINEVSCDWRRAGHLATILVSDWSKS